MNDIPMMNKNFTILVVDDDQTNIDVVVSALGGEYKTISALSAFEAIDQLKEQMPDLILLDVMMPGKSGVETLKEIKNSWPITEVIMLTGHGSVETAIEGMKLGAYDYLIKPTETEDLSQKITSAYQRKSDHEERIRQAEINKIIEHKGW